MSDATDRIVAIKLVTDRVQPNTAPTLTTGEIELEVDRAKLASTWATATVYKVGDVIVPADRNGHSYECVQPGTSQAGIHLYSDWLIITGTKMSDGNSNPALTWREIGTDRFNAGIFGAETNIYDINRAAKECWLIKARKSSEYIAADDHEFQQVHEQCLKMAATFKPFARPIELIRG